MNSSNRKAINLKENILEKKIMSFFPSFDRIPDKIIQLKKLQLGNHVITVGKDLKTYDLTF